MSSSVRELVRPRRLRQDHLDRAAERVLREHGGDSIVDLDDDALRSEVETVVTLVRHASGGGRLEAPGPELLDRARVLHALRTALVADWSDADGSILPMMEAIEVVQRHLVEWVDDASVTDVLAPFAQGLVREVAHLLRSPLGSVAMLAALLGEERSGPLNEMQKRQLDIIYRAALGATSLTADLVTLIDQKQCGGESEQFTVSDMMHRVADVARPVAEARGCELAVRCLVDGPRFGPASRLGQALLEIVLRAAMGVRDGRVELAAEPAGRVDVHFSVSSTSGGRPAANGTKEDEISDDILRVLRVDAGSGVHSLSTEGLGLSAARTILRSIGSDLEVDQSRRGVLRLTTCLALPAPSAGGSEE